MKKPNRPNIIFIMTDQHRFDCMGCAGNDVVKTPNLDWLASHGTRFTAAYTPSPSCIPARACMISGQNQWNAGILGMSYEMGAGCGGMGVGFPHTLPGELAKAGYQTIGIGKMHFTPQRALMGFHQTILDESSREEDHGFKSDYKKWFEKNRPAEFDFAGHGMGWNSWMGRPYHAPEYLHSTYWTVEQSIEFLKNRDISMPFFMHVSFERPHSPYDPPQYYFDMYKDKELPGPSVGDWAEINDVPLEAKKPDAMKGKLAEDDLQTTRAAYYGSVSFIDHQIGRLLFYLKDQEILENFDNTMVVFSADHGDMQGDHHLYRKGCGYEGSAHIPLIVYMPDAMDKTGMVNEVTAPALLQDVMPTILDAAGVDIPETCDGISLLPQMFGASCERKYVHGENSCVGMPEKDVQYVVDERFKYLWHPRLDGTELGELLGEQLFDLQNDPGETKDLSGDPAYQDVLERFRAYLVSVLEPRNAGYTENGKLVSQAGKPAVAPPSYMERYNRSSYKWVDLDNK